MAEAEFNGKKGKWRTVKGRRIFFPDGVDEKSVLNESFGEGFKPSKKRINKGKYEKSDDDGETWDELEDTESYNDYYGDEDAFDENQDSDFGEEKLKVHVSYNGKEADIEIEGDFEEDWQVDEAVREKLEEMEGEEVEDFEWDIANENDEEFKKAMDDAGYEINKEEYGIKKKEEPTAEEMKEVEDFSEMKAKEMAESAKKYQQEHGFNKKYNVGTLSGEAFEEQIEAGSPEEAERLAQQKYPGRGDELTVEEDLPAPKNGRYYTADDIEDIDEGPRVYTDSHGVQWTKNPDKGDGKNYGYSRVDNPDIVSNIPADTGATPQEGWNEEESNNEENTQEITNDVSNNGFLEDIANKTGVKIERKGGQLLISGNDGDIDQFMELLYNYKQGK